MKYLNKENIIIVFLVVLTFNSLLSLSTDRVPDLEYEIKLHDLSQEKKALESENTKLHNKLNDFENEILKNDSIIDNSTNEQLDSMFTNYFNR